MINYLHSVASILRSVGRASLSFVRYWTSFAIGLCSKYIVANFLLFRKLSTHFQSAIWLELAFSVKLKWGKLIFFSCFDSRSVFDGNEFEHEWFNKQCAVPNYCCYSETYPKFFEIFQMINIFNDRNAILGNVKRFQLFILFQSFDLLNSILWYV